MVLHAVHCISFNKDQTGTVVQVGAQHLNHWGFAVLLCHCTVLLTMMLLLLLLLQFNLFPLFSEYF